MKHLKTLLLQIKYIFFKGVNIKLKFIKKLVLENKTYSDFHIFIIDGLDLDYCVGN